MRFPAQLNLLRSANARSPSPDISVVTGPARLRSTLRESDTLARMSGDEFTVIANGLCFFLRIHGSS